MQAHPIEKTDYQPLMAVIGIILAASLALQVGHSLDVMVLMNHIMGLFFLLFAMFKFFNISGFADGFQMYDIVARKFRGYAYSYPFIELGLGILYLSGLFPLLANGLTVLVMTISAIGVFKSMRSGSKFKCACLGTVLNVPLSTVSLVENLGMGLMAAYMLANFSL